MKKSSMLRKILIGAAGLTLLALAFYAYSAPRVVLHYAADASKPVAFFLNEDNTITKGTLHPGTSQQFRTAGHPHADYFIEVSLPLDSQDGVEIKPPFSRVDVYVGADTRIKRTAVRTDFLARLENN